MLFGRNEECARIDAVLDAARNRRSGSLVLRGQAGIGKTALLEYAVAHAHQFRVLRATGVESEAEIAFAGLQQLVRPILYALADLPGAQAHALGTALAIEDGRRPERLAVSVAVLSLLAAAAEDQPLLCVIDDAHWLDHASAEALTFAARRMEAEAVEGKASAATSMRKLSSVTSAATSAISRGVLGNGFLSCTCSSAVP